MKRWDVMRFFLTLVHFFLHTDKHRICSHQQPELKTLWMMNTRSYLHRFVSKELFVSERWDDPFLLGKVWKSYIVGTTWIDTTPAIKWVLVQQNSLCFSFLPNFSSILNAFTFTRCGDARGWQTLPCLQCRGSGHHGVKLCHAEMRKFPPMRSTTGWRWGNRMQTMF